MKYLIGALLIFFISFPAAGQTIEETKVAIQKLQPRVPNKRAKQLAGYINRHSKTAQIDSLLVTAIIFRESSFSYAVQVGRKRGKPPQRCIGLMQIVPWGRAHKLGGYCSLGDADCNIRTGTRWLEYTRSICGDTTWQWIAAYGMSRCPRYWEAHRNGATITARNLYCKIKKNCNVLWPRRRKITR